MAEGIEALAPMVAPHAAHPHAPEAHMARGEMHDGVVDAPTAKGNVAREASLRRTILAKDVERERRRPSHHELLCLVKIVEREHRQHRAEDLLLHHGIIGRDVIEDRRLDLEGLGPRAAAIYDLAPVDKPHHAIEMLR